MSSISIDTFVKAVFKIVHYITKHLLSYSINFLSNSRLQLFKCTRSFFENYALEVPPEEKKRMGRSRMNGPSKELLRSGISRDLEKLHGRYSCLHRKCVLSLYIAEIRLHRLVNAHEL